MSWLQNIFANLIIIGRVSQLWSLYHKVVIYIFVHFMCVGGGRVYFLDPFMLLSFKNGRYFQYLYNVFMVPIVNSAQSVQTPISHLFPLFHNPHPTTTVSWQTHKLPSLRIRYGRGSADPSITCTPQ